MQECRLAATATAHQGNPPTSRDGAADIAKGVKLGARGLTVNLLMDAARDMGLRHLTCMLISDLEKDAIEVLKQLGFEEYRIPGYGVDPDGDAHDMSKLVFSF